MSPTRIDIVRDCYAADEAGDRDLVERRLADDFTSSAPPDVGTDRAIFGFDGDKVSSVEVYFGWDLP